VEAELVQALAEHQRFGGVFSLAESCLPKLPSAHNSQYGQTLCLHRLRVR
jgi:hypothetical protein